MAQKCSDVLTQYKTAITTYLEGMNPDSTENTPEATFNKCRAGVDYELINTFEKIKEAAGVVAVEGAVTEWGQAAADLFSSG